MWCKAKKDVAKAKEKVYDKLYEKRKICLFIIAAKKRPTPYYCCCFKLNVQHACVSDWGTFGHVMHFIGYKKKKRRESHPTKAYCQTMVIMLIYDCTGNITLQY